MIRKSIALPLTGSKAFAWGCCIEGLHFLYVYEVTADYRAFQAQDTAHPGNTLTKGWGASLDEVREAAATAASALVEIYGEVGSVRLVNAREPVRERGFWPPLNVPAAQAALDRRPGHASSWSVCQLRTSVPK